MNQVGLYIFALHQELEKILVVVCDLQAARKSTVIGVADTGGVYVPNITEGAYGPSPCKPRSLINTASSS